MKAGRLPYKFGEGMCAFDALEKDDYFPIFGYKGSCPNCEIIRVPNEIWGIYKGIEGIYHTFSTMYEYRCEGCGCILNSIAVMCMVGTVNITEEIEGLKGK